MVPGGKVVKAINTIFAAHQADPLIDGIQLDGFVASDDIDAKKKVLEFVGSLGFRPIDAGPLAMARAGGHGRAEYLAKHDEQLALADRLEASRSNRRERVNKGAGPGVRFCSYLLGASNQRGDNEDDRATSDDRGDRRRTDQPHQD
jgi:hypothetical protein